MNIQFIPGLWCRYFDSVRHIEVQIMGDKHGNVIHCFEVCSPLRKDLVRVDSM